MREFFNGLLYFFYMVTDRNTFSKLEFEEKIKLGEEYFYKARRARGERKKYLTTQLLYTIIAGDEIGELGGKGKKTEAFLRLLRLAVSDADINFRIVESVASRSRSFHTWYEEYLTLYLSREKNIEARYAGIIMNPYFYSEKQTDEEFRKRLADIDLEFIINNSAEKIANQEVFKKERSRLRLMGVWGIVSFSDEEQVLSDQEYRIFKRKELGELIDWLNLNTERGKKFRDENERDERDHRRREREAEEKFREEKIKKEREERLKEEERRLLDELKKSTDAQQKRKAQQDRKRKYEERKAREQEEAQREEERLRDHKIEQYMNDPKWVYKNKDVQRTVAMIRYRIEQKGSFSDTQKYAISKIYLPQISKSDVTSSFCKKRFGLCFHQDSQNGDIKELLDSFERNDIYLKLGFYVDLLPQEFDFENNDASEFG